MICPCGNEAERGYWCPECEAHESEERGRRLNARIAKSGIPAALTGTEFPDGPAAEAAEEWARGDMKGLCLTGPVGVGKTHLAAAACWERLQTYSTRWVSVARLMAQLRGDFKSRARLEALEALTGTGALVLDDLDKVNPTDFGKEAIFAAIDGRVEEGSPLLVTTNLGMSEIGAMLGDSVASRLAGYCRVVKMVGEDRRLAA